MKGRKQKERKSLMSVSRCTVPLSSTCPTAAEEYITKTELNFHFASMIAEAYFCLYEFLIERNYCLVHMIAFQWLSNPANSAASETCVELLAHCSHLNYLEEAWSGPFLPLKQPGDCSILRCKNISMDEVFVTETKGFGTLQI